MTDFDPNNIDHLKALEHSMLHESGVETAMDVSTLDGFLTAIVCGPELIRPSEWFELIWGEDGAPEWESTEQFVEFFDKVIAMMNAIAATLMNDPMQFEPLFLERKVDGRTYTVVDEWCDGFLQGVALRQAAWGRMPGDDLAPMLTFTSEAGSRLLDEMTDEEVAFWQSQIEPAVRRIHAYWLARRSDEPAGPGAVVPFPSQSPVVRAAPKIGRNDPCPCGSGRKYKRCCGAH